MSPVIVGLDAAGTPDAWRAAGFTVVDGAVWIGSVRVQCDIGERGIGAWVLADGPEVDEVDGLATRAGTAEVAPELTHPNGATLIDHLVVWTPDSNRTTAALSGIGMEVKRVREDARPGVRQTFFRAGEVIVELVAPLEPEGGPARFFGLAVNVEDLDACAVLLGDALGPVKEAVQPGRRIATLRHRDIGLPVAVAYMSV
ncbi:MAG: glyoxalase [Actinomycetota bacterium]|nr:glyoxalase [Actinomycetota bacterium]